jgi:hypothetical protein
MPAGNRQRTWFPEMVEVLRAEWRAEMSWDDLIALRDRLDRMLQHIRASRHIELADDACCVPTVGRPWSKPHRTSRCEPPSWRWRASVSHRKQRSRRSRSAGKRTGRPLDAICTGSQALREARRDRLRTMQELRRANDDTVGAQAAVPAGGLPATLAEIMCGRLRAVAVVGDREGTTLTTGSVIGCGNMQELHTSNADKVGTQATVLARALCALVA